MLYGDVMNKYQKIITYIIIVIILILISVKILNVNSISYKIRNENDTFNVKEKYDGEKYNITIINNKRQYLINIYDNLNKSKRIIDKIYNYSDKKYQCVFPVIKEKMLTDIMCYKDSVLYNYSQIKGENSKLDNYVSTIKEYKKSGYENKDAYNVVDTVKFYNNKINNVVSTTSYKGLYINAMQVNLFKNDVYSNKINTYIDNYYLTADYNKEYEFNTFYLVNLNNSEVDKIESKESISFDSYIQGIVDKKIYLYDFDNEIQYEIDIYNKKINIVSNNEYIKYYANKKWEKLSKSKVKKDIYFDYTTLDNDFSDYDYVKYSKDYYYLLNKDNGNYKIYRVNKNNIEIKTYIGVVPTLDIYFNKDYFYYTYNNVLYFYSDKTSFKTILENTEKKFNDTIKYYIY